MSDYAYAKVDPSEVPQVWLEVSPLINKAMATTTPQSSAEHFRRAIVDGKMDLFVALSDGKVAAILISQFIRHSNFTAFRVCIMAGTEPLALETAMVEYWPKLIAWSRTHGATKWEATCHPSMARLLRQHGFTHTSVICTMDIEGE